LAADFRAVALHDLTIDDERSFAHVAIYGELAKALAGAAHRFWVPVEGARVTWDRALFLNLTYWNATEGADVLCEDHLPADVLAHIAWHHIVGARLAGPAASGKPSAAAMLFAESIASAFDLYLIGRLLWNAPESDFITTQVPLISACAEDAGLSEKEIEALLSEVAREPERAFEELRALLFEAATSLLACPGVMEAAAVLKRFEGHRFEPLLHHFQLSNWILYARAYAADPAQPDPAVDAASAALRAAPDSLAWLRHNWLVPLLSAG
jgi:hypothetical protein